ncbi:hypothetical protein MPSEU_000212700 [Mayamaea pseudoterrestris]|nr:hypothetical protein MPSEU_000212700 [Mayamaea pseudoterrestris]
MKTEKMIMSKFGLKYGEASKIVKQARLNLGLPPSCTWTEELEEVSCRLCAGESDNNHVSKSLVAHDSISTTATSTSTIDNASRTTKPNQPIDNDRTNTPSMQPRATSKASECTSRQFVQNGEIFTANKLVADLQHDTLLEGTADQTQSAPKLPVRKSSNSNLEDSGSCNIDDANAVNVNDESDSYSDDDEAADMPLPVIRPLRRTDDRTKYA